MLGDDGMDSSTQVPTVKCVWVHVATSCHARHVMSPFPEVLALVALSWYQKPFGEVVGSLSTSQTGGKRRIGLTCGKILLAHGYQDGGACCADYSWVWFFLGWWSLLFS
jgi:hypothetical protein